MKRFSRIVFTAALTAAALWSCAKDPVVPDNTGPVKLSAECKWIYDELCKSYYWNDAVKKATPKSGLEYDAFLEKLLTNLKGAQDDTENPPTIDGYYYYDQYNRKQHQIYSYIDRTEKMRSGSESMVETFGFGFEVFWRDQDSGLYCFLITWTQPGGPAEKKGLKRGVWIYKYNGKDIKYGDYENFFYQAHNMEGGTSMSLTDDGGKVYDLKAETIKATPILVNEMVTSPGGKNAAYLVYNAFETGDDGEFDEDLKSVFAGFKTGGAEELILDVRYNPGGYVNCCQLLTSLSANVDKSKVFAKLQYNSSATGPNPELMYFLDGKETRPWISINDSHRLKLSTIYVLATRGSASASEMVISSLRGIDGITVVHIGDWTEGKNVGMDRKLKTIGNYEYEMWPITFKIKNAKDFCNYAGGFEPDYLIDEFRNRKNGVLELGDVNEELLKAALTLIDGGKPVVDDPSKAGTRASDGTGRIANPLKAAGGGAKIVRNEEGEIVM